jgi:hypothetical protein
VRLGLERGELGIVVAHPRRHVERQRARLLVGRRPSSLSIMRATSNRRRKKASVLAQVALSTSLSIRSGCSIASTWPIAPPVEWPHQWTLSKPSASISCSASSAICATL